VKPSPLRDYAAAYYAIDISNLEYHHLKVCSVVVGENCYYYLYSGLSVLKIWPN